MSDDHDDIPEHLIHAWSLAERAETEEDSVREFLAALRPEDPVPAFEKRQASWQAIVDVLKEERDEARAEVERLQSALTTRLAQAGQLRAEIERLKATLAEAWERLDGNAWDRLSKQCERLKAEVERLRQQYEPAIPTAEHSMESDYCHELEQEIERLRKQLEIARDVTGDGGLL